MADVRNDAGKRRQRESDSEEAEHLGSEPSNPSKIVKLSHASEDQQAAEAQTTSRSVRLEDVNHWTSLSKHAEFQMPSRLSSYSLDSQREQYHDDRQRKYYRDPIQADRAPRDLNYGYERFQTRENMGPERLDTLLYSLVNEAKSNSSVNAELRRAGVVTWRGIMTKICTLPYAGRDELSLNAQMLNGAIYLEENLTEERKMDMARQENNPRSRKFAYHGYSFESWCTTAEPNLGPLWGGDVNTNEQWCHVVKTKLGNHRLVFGGEVDCVNPEDPRELIELKASMVIRSATDEEKFETKMLRFYMQSFLLGIAKVVVGFRDPKGFLQTVQSFKTLEMPRLVRGKPHAWDPKACLSSAAHVLDNLKEILSTAPEGAVWRLTRRPGDAKLQIRPLSGTEVATQVENDSVDRLGMLPHEYVSFLRESEEK